MSKMLRQRSNEARIKDKAQQDFEERLEINDKEFSIEKE